MNRTVTIYHRRLFGKNNNYLLNGFRYLSQSSNQANSADVQNNTSNLEIPSINSNQDSLKNSKKYYKKINVKESITQSENSIDDDDNNNNNNPITNISPIQKKLKDIKLYLNSDRIKGSVNFNRFFSHYWKAKEIKYEFSTEELLNVLWACNEIAADQSDLRSVNNARDVYNIFKQRNQPIPYEAYALVLRVFATNPRSGWATGVYNDFIKHFPEDPEEIIESFLLANARSKVEITTQTMYRKFLANTVKKGWRGSIELYTEMASFFSSINRSEDAVAALAKMTSLNFEPTHKDCFNLLVKSLYSGDVRLLRVLGSWYLLNFDTVLPEGIIDRFLQVSATIGDLELAKIAIKLKEKYEYTVDSIDYICLARAATLNCDYVSVVEILIESGKKGFDLYSLHPDLAGNLQLLLGKSFTSVYVLDQVYYAIIELFRQDNSLPVPILAVNAIILGAGKRGQLDRAFATFKECQTLFKQPPSIFSYNALLHAISLSRLPSVVNILSIFQEMENDGISPNSESVSILFTVMAESGDLKGFDEIYNFMKTKGIKPSERSFRRILISLSNKKEFDKLDQLIADHYSDTLLPDTVKSEVGQTVGDLKPKIPSFLRERLLKLREINSSN